MLAKAVCQSTLLSLTHRLREQARSHREFLGNLKRVVSRQALRQLVQQLLLALVFEALRLFAVALHPFAQEKLCPAATPRLPLVATVRSDSRSRKEA